MQFYAFGKCVLHSKTTETEQHEIIAVHWKSENRGEQLYQKEKKKTRAEQLVIKLPQEI